MMLKPDTSFSGRHLNGGELQRKLSGYISSANAEGPAKDSNVPVTLSPHVNVSPLSSERKGSQGVWVNQLVTHLPDQITYADHAKAMPFQNTFQGILMFLDISGFTSLCEKYSMNAKNGTDQLTKTLNGYMEALVHEIIMHDGDVMKFAGDAILTVWKVDAFARMRPSIYHVLRCAMSIQKKYGEWTTNVGVKLRVKIGIAAGEVNVAFLGNSEFCHYVTVGRAVEAVNLAEKFCVSGDTVVSPSAWCHCSNLPIEFEILEDKKHVKIFSVNEMEEGTLEYKMSQTVEVSEAIGNLLCANIGSTSVDEVPSKSEKLDEDHLMAKTSSIGTAETENISKFKAGALAASVKTKKDKGKTRKATKSTRIVRVRKAVIDEAIDEGVNNKLKLYVAVPVLKKIEEQQPLAYLSEMRQVTIVFMNLTLEECSKYELSWTMQSAFNTIYANVKKMQGCMNKIFMFDKGCTFLVIFGLPGFKHENDCGHALQCAHYMKAELDNIEKVTRTSIGVTTGSTFCGVVGHNHRHEYTVIGRKVNMAARLMMYYPDKVTCDSETFHHSKMPKGNFLHLELKEMKGLQNVGVIREFKPCSNPRDNVEALIAQDQEFPIIGRDKELQIFLQELTQITCHSTKGTQRQVIVYEGEIGIGKTRIIDAISVKALQNSVRVVNCTLSMHDAKTPYYAVKSLIMDFLGFTFDQTHQEREHLLFNTFVDRLIMDNACLLNDILGLKLPQKEKILHMESSERASLLNKILFHMVHELTTKKGLIIFVIDDAHYMDLESWDFIRVLGHDMQSLVILTMRQPYRALGPMANQVLEDSATLRVPIQGLHPSHLAPLACQLLGVVKIPVKLDVILREKSNGVPSWCEQLLSEMLFDGIMEVRKSQSVQSTEEMIEPSLNIIGKKVKENSSTVKTEENFIPEDLEAGSVCVLLREISSGVPDSIKGMIQARIDRMEEIDQLIIKTSSVLGMSFLKVMLKSILPSNVTDSQLRDSVQRLSDSGNFICGTKVQSSGSGQFSVLKESTKGQKTCVCPQSDGQNERPMSECLQLRFQSSSTLETAYQMFLESNRRTLHIKAAKFLEAQAHKCVACGGGDFIQSLTQVNFSEEAAEKISTKTGKQGMVLQTNLGIVPTYQHKPGGAAAQSTKRRLSVMTENVQPISLNKPLVSSSKKNKKNPIKPNTKISSEISHTSQGSSNVPPLLKEEKSGEELAASDITPEITVEQLESALKESRNMEDSEERDEEVSSCLDLRECNCATILVKVYPKLVHHWRAAGNIEKTVHFLMEASAAAIAILDNMKALSYLREAGRILECVKTGENPFEGETAFIEQTQFDVWEEARLQSLIGQALFHMGQVSEAVPHFKSSLDILGYRLPMNKVRVWWGILAEGLRQWKHTKFPSHYIGKSSVYDAVICVEQARSLSHILHHYLVTRKKSNALLVVLKQLNSAEMADLDFHELIMAYTSMMETCQVLNWPSLGQLYEYKAHIRAIQTTDNLCAEDLLTRAHLYCSSLNSRLVWGRIQEAIDSGYSAHRLTGKLHDNDLQIQMLPIMAQALLMANRVVDAVDILRQLDYIQNETDDVIAKAWYYAGCMDSLLELGFQVEPYHVCIDFAKKAKTDNTFMTGQLPLYYLACCITLWYERKSDFHSMGLWQEQALKNMPASLDNYMAVHAFVKMIECKLILLANCANNRKKNKSLVKKLKQEINVDMNKLKKACIKMPVFKTRLMHLKAYNHAIHNKMKAANALLTKCIVNSASLGNIMEMHWATHSQQVWFDPDYDRMQADFWLDHAADNEELPDWHLSEEIEGSVTKFSLPLPHWFDD